MRKKHKLPPLERFRAFEAAARYLSFKAAAEEIGITASAISHRIRNLEVDLGAILFERTGNAITLTEAGSVLFADTTEALRRLENIWDKLLIEGQGRQIVISSAPMIAARFLLPNLEQFSKIHKRIDFKFVSTNQITNVKNRESDIAIRLGKPPEKTLYYEELLPVSVFAVCLKSAKPKFIKNKVVSGPLIGNTFLKNEWDVFRQLYPMNMDPYVKILWFDSLEAQLNAVLAGQGIGLLPDWLVDQIEPVNTISLLSERIPSGLSYWIVMRKESSSDPSIRTLKKWIHGCLISE